MQVIISEIDGYIQNNGGVFQNWYIGITFSPRERLFIGHQVIEDEDCSNEARGYKDEKVPDSSAPSEKLAD